MAASSFKLLKILAFVFLLIFETIESVSKLNNESFNSEKILAEFLLELSEQNFKKCTQILLTFDEFESGNAWYFKTLMENDEDSLQFFPVVHFKFNETVLNSLPKNAFLALDSCVVYVSVVDKILDALPWFLMEQKEWDKFFHSRKHVIFTESSVVDVKKFLEVKEMDTFSNLVIVIDVKKGNCIVVIENTVYRKKNDALYKFRGEFCGKNTPFSFKSLFSDKMQNFNGYEMKAVGFHFPPRVIARKVKNNVEMEWNGIDVDMIRSICKVLNIKVTFHTPSDGGTWGVKSENGLFDGMVGDIQRKIGDIGFTDWYVNEDPMSAVEFSIQYDGDQATFLVKSPDFKEITNALLLPFDSTVWTVFLLSVFLGIAFSMFLANLRMRLFSADRNSWFNKYLNNGMFLVSLIITYSRIREINQIHMRIFAITWTFGYFILAFKYKYYLLSYLTIPTEEMPIDTFEQLYRTDIPVSLGRPFYAMIMKTSANPEIKQLLERSDNYTLSDCKDVLKKTADGTYAMSQSRMYLEFLLESNLPEGVRKENLRIMGESIAFFGIGIGFRKYVPYVNSFNKVIIRLTEGGFPNYFLKKAIDDYMTGEYQGKNQISVETNRKQSLSLKQLRTVFHLLMFGHFLGFIAFLCEKIIFRYSQKKAEMREIQLSKAQGG